MIISAVFASTFLIIVATATATVLVSFAVSAMIVPIAAASFRWTAKKRKNPFKLCIESNRKILNVQRFRIIIREKKICRICVCLAVRVKG